MLNTRVASSAEAERIAEIGKDAGLDVNLDHVLNSLADRSRRIVIAEMDGEIIGYIEFQITSIESEMIDIAVDPSCRGIGIGEELVNTYQNSMTGRAPLDEVKIFLEVAEDNASAIRLYEKTGFHVVSRRKNYYKGNKDALVMQWIGRPEPPRFID